MRTPGAASDSLAPLPSSWKALLLSSFRVGETFLRRKQLRKRVLRTVQAACEAAGVAPPGRAELKAKFAAKLAACGKLAVEGNRVLLRVAQKGAEQPPLPAPAEPEEDGEEEEEVEEAPDARRRRQPSYQAWHTAPLAQRSGPWRCACCSLLACCTCCLRASPSPSPCLWQPGGAVCAGRKHPVVRAPAGAGRGEHAVAVQHARQEDGAPQAVAGNISGGASPLAPPGVEPRHSTTAHRLLQGRVERTREAGAAAAGGAARTQLGGHWTGAGAPPRRVPRAVSSAAHPPRLTCHTAALTPPRTRTGGAT